MKVTDLIKSLKSSKTLRITCPGCDNNIPISKLEMFTEEHLTEGALDFIKQRHIELNELKSELIQLKKLRLERVKRGAFSSNLGKILEKFAPVLPGFNLKPAELIPLFDPIDYISFNGLSRDKIESITFMDIKSGKGKLGHQQEAIKKVVEAGKLELTIIKKGNKC